MVWPGVSSTSVVNGTLWSTQHLYHRYKLRVPLALEQHDCFAYGKVQSGKWETTGNAGEDPGDFG